MNFKDFFQIELCQNSQSRQNLKKKSKLYRSIFIGILFTLFTMLYMGIIIQCSFIIIQVYNLINDNTMKCENNLKPNTNI